MAIHISVPVTCAATIRGVQEQVRRPLISCGCSLPLATPSLGLLLGAPQLVQHILQPRVRAVPRAVNSVNLLLKLVQTFSSITTLSLNTLH